MLKMIIAIISIVFLISCGAKEEKVKKEEYLDTSILTIIQRKPYKDKCEYLGRIEESGFDFKSTRELVYYSALKKKATHIYIDKVTTAYTNAANPKKKDNMMVSGEVFLVKGKAYKCEKDE